LSWSLILGDDVESRVFRHFALAEEFGQAIDPLLGFGRVAKPHVDVPTCFPAAPSRDFLGPFAQDVQIIL
jgi:hypothetical protein